MTQAYALGRMPISRPGTHSAAANRQAL